LVVKLAKETSLAQAIWHEARAKKDFNIFVPSFRKIVDLLKEKADRIGFETHPYDALLDEYEPFMNSETIKKVFEPLQTGLTKILKKIGTSNPVDIRFLSQQFSVKKQDEFGRMVLKDMGYFSNNGRLDISAHPFTITLGSNDVRITTRYDETSLLSGLFSDIHEGGHALYELGFSKDIQGNILATGTSLGIHESQSRMWENQIGRSYKFWQFFYPKLKELFID
jgi:carboxypeptidase Taq